MVGYEYGHKYRVRAGRVSGVDLVLRVCILEGLGDLVGRAPMRLQ